MQLMLTYGYTYRSFCTDIYFHMLHQFTSHNTFSALAFTCVESATCDTPCTLATLIVLISLVPRGKAGQTSSRITSSIRSSRPKFSFTQKVSNYLFQANVITQTKYISRLENFRGTSSFHMEILFINVPHPLGHTH